VIESSPLSCAARCPSSLSLPRAQMFKPLSFKSQEELFHSHHTSKWELLFFFLIQIIYFRHVALSLVHEKPKHHSLHAQGRLDVPLLHSSGCRPQREERPCPLGAQSCTAW